MKECPDTDALVSICNAMKGDVAEGLRHLQSCDHCLAQLELLQVTHSAFATTESVDDAIVGRISAALHTEARSEQTHGQTAELWANALEPLLAGITALIVVVSSGIEIGGIAAGLLCFVLGAVVVICGRRLYADYAGG